MSELVVNNFGVTINDPTPQQFYALEGICGEDKTAWTNKLRELFVSLILTNRITGYLPETTFAQAIQNDSDIMAEYQAPTLFAEAITEEDFEVLEGYGFVKDLVEALADGVKDPCNKNRLATGRPGDADVITVVCEVYHVDAAYRDSYYTYYSRKHFSVGRFSTRLTFFPALLTEKTWDERYPEIKDKLLASCVINPILQGSVGTTYVDPRVYLHSSSAWARLSTFRVNVLGKPFDVLAFPYRKQDGESMRCAEVTLLNLFSYYANTYADYALMQGSQIRALEEQYAYERSLPSRGITYLTLSRILSNAGFYPRLYNTSSMGEESIALTAEDCMHRTLFRYVESGIPVAVNPAPDTAREGHSLLCIGYSRPDDWASDSANTHRNEIRLEYGSDFTGSSDGKDAGVLRTTISKRSSRTILLTDAADYRYQFIVIDDNQMPYELRDFNQLSNYPEMHTECLVAPLNLSMMLDAMDAQEKVEALLGDYRNGIVNWVGSYFSDRKHGKLQDPAKDIAWTLTDESPIEVGVVKRLFMVSSKTFRRFRVSHLKDPFIRELYASIPMPRFLWICELYEEDRFQSDNPRAFAELVLDATAVSTEGQIDGVIICNYPYWIGFRTPDYPYVDYERVYQKRADDLIPFTGNLTMALSNCGARG